MYTVWYDIRREGVRRDIVQDKERGEPTTSSPRPRVQQAKGSRTGDGTGNEHRGRRTSRQGHNRQGVITSVVAGRAHRRRGREIMICGPGLSSSWLHGRAAVQRAVSRRWARADTPPTQRMTTTKPISPTRTSSSRTTRTTTLPNAASPKVPSQGTEVGEYDYREEQILTRD